MKKNYNIIQINSLTGLLFVLLIVAGFICSFILLPVWVVKSIWNMVVGEMLLGPKIQYYQAALLWIAMAIGLYLCNNKSIRIKVVKDDEEIIENNNVEFLMKEESEND